MLGVDVVPVMIWPSLIQEDSGCKEMEGVTNTCDNRKLDQSKLGDEIVPKVDYFS